MKASAKNLAGRIPSFVSALCLSLLALAAGPAGGATSARTFAELEAAFAGGETRCALAADIACERPLAVAEGKALELDLNDHRLTVRCSNAIIVTKGSKLVLKNAGSSCFGSTHLQKGCILPDDDHADILSSISPIILCQDGSTLEMRRGFVGNCRQGDWSLHFGAAIHARGTARVSVIGTSVIRGNPAISAEGLAQVEVDGNGGSKDMYDVVITGNGSEGPTSVVPQRKYGTVFEITDGNPSFTLGNCVVDCRGNLFRSAEGASGSITINNGFYATYITPFLLSGRTSLTLVDGIFEQLDVCLKPIVMPCEDGDPTGTDARPSPASVSIRESFGFGLSCDPEDVARIIPAALLEDGQKVESRPLKAYANRWNGDRTDNANKINCRTTASASA